MKYSKLGRTRIDVSRICLGSMTWGEQNSQSDADAQLGVAVDMGVNFIDTAEMYSVPSRKETYGATEAIIGDWLRRNPGIRKELVIATKVVGPCSDWMPYIRHGQTRLDRRNIHAAVTQSLARLNTDYIDLYQVHWPERNTNYFGRLGYRHEVETDVVPIEETLHALSELVDAGKVRAVGVSNESPWGVFQYLGLSERGDLARIASIQNPYNLLNRAFEVGLAEVAIREQTGLLAYSPLGFGVLSGKYLDGKGPGNARLNLPEFKRFTRYSNPIPVKATGMYVDVARAHGLEPAQMALAYVNQRPFVTSTIIGATSIDQLEHNIASIDVELSDDVIKDIEGVHKQHPNPAP